MKQCWTYDATKDITQVIKAMAAWIGLVSICSWQQVREAVLVSYLLGAVCSLCYVLILYRQMKSCINLPKEEFIAHLHVGRIARFGLVLVLFTVSRLWPQVQFPAALAGFFCFHTVMLVYGMFQYVYRLVAGSPMWSPRGD